MTMPKILAVLVPAGLILGLAGCGGQLPGGKATAQQWRVSELAFTAGGSYAQPASEVSLAATFTGPGGERFEIPGFWDGGQTWRVRFTPTAPGKWTYVTTATPASDAGLNGKTGSLSAAPASGDNLLYRHGGFLRVSDNKRYLTYTDGTPFFWLGDTWWFAPSSLVPFDGSTNPQYPSMFKALIDTRQKQGFTIAHMAFLGPISQSAGVNSFTDLAVTRQIDPAYWQNVDRYINYANDAGIMPAIALVFHSGLDQLPLDDWKFLWRYVEARYGAHAVTWIISGEYNITQDAPADRVPKVLKLGQFIKDTDPYKRAMSVHPWWFRGDKHQAWDEPWYDFIMFQGAHQAYPESQVYWDAWARSEPKPVLEAECNYEGIHKMTDADVRWCAYHAIEAGSFGYTYGAQGLWYPTQNESDQTFKEWGDIIPWWVALNQPGGAQMRYLRDIYESVEWWKLEPRPDGVGMLRQWGDMLHPRLKADGDKVYVVWFPKNLPKKTEAWINRAPAGGTYRGQWANPRTGEKTDLPAALPVEDGRLDLPDRADGQDWILILRQQ